MGTNDGKCNKIKAIYSFTTHIQANFYCRHTCHQPKTNPYLFLMSHLKCSIFRDGYISRFLEILIFSEAYNRPKYQKIPIREI